MLWAINKPNVWTEEILLDFGKFWQIGNILDWAAKERRNACKVFASQGEAGNSALGNKFAQNEQKMQNMQQQKEQTKNYWAILDFWKPCKCAIPRKRKEQWKNYTGSKSTGFLCCFRFFWQKISNLIIIGISIIVSNILHTGKSWNEAKSKIATGTAAKLFPKRRKWEKI